MIGAGAGTGTPASIQRFCKCKASWAHIAEERTLLHRLGQVISCDVAVALYQPRCVTSSIR